MPKLPKQLMDHRYECPWCGKSLPTSQGMSGHIQFAHSAETLGDEPGVEKKDLVHETRVAKRFESILNDPDKAEIAEMLETEIDWEVARKHLKTAGVKLTNADYKFFALASLACAFSNLRMVEKIKKEIRSLLA
jgi:hypothetical protein